MQFLMPITKHEKFLFLSHIVFNRLSYSHMIPSMTSNDYDLWLVISPHCSNSPNYPTCMHTISITLISAHTVLSCTITYTMSIQYHDSHCHIQLVLITHTPTVTHTDIIHNHTYNHSIPTLTVSNHTHYHTHSPYPQYKTIIYQSFPTCSCHLPIIYTHNQHPHHLCCHTYSSFTFKTLHFPIIYFIQQSNTLMMSTFQIIITLFHYPFLFISLHLSASESRYTSYFPQHHTHKH